MQKETERLAKIETEIKEGKNTEMKQEEIERQKIRVARQIGKILEKGDERIEVLSTHEDFNDRALKFKQKSTELKKKNRRREICCWFFCCPCMLLGLLEKLC